MNTVILNTHEMKYLNSIWKIDTHLKVKKENIRFTDNNY